MLHGMSNPFAFRPPPPPDPMEQILQGLPLVPEDVNGRPSDHLVRAMVAAALNYFDPAKAGSEKVARRLWPDDSATHLVTRAATVPADTATSGWASQLAGSAVADLVMTMGPTACAGELFRRAIALQFGTAAAITVPGLGRPRLTWDGLRKAHRCRCNNSTLVPVRR